MSENVAKEPSLYASLKVQIRIINALVMREVLTRFGRRNIGFLWLFVEPILFCVVISFVWAVIRERQIAASLSVPVFALTGYTALFLVRNASNRCSMAVQPNVNLLYHRNVRVTDLFLSRLILEIMASTTTLIVLTLVFAYFGFGELPRYPMIAIQAWFLLAWFALALSLCVGGICVRMEGFSRIWRVFMYIYFPISGAVFMIDWLPLDSFKQYGLWVPTVHGTEMLRHGYFGDSVRTYEDPAYFAKINLFMTMIGLALVRSTDRRVSPI